MLKLECAPVPPYLLFSRGRRPVDQLRRYVVPAKWRQMDTPLRKAGYVGGAVGWPVIAAFKAWQEVRQYGREVRQMSGRSKPSQFVDQWRLACWYGLAPHSYYMYGLFLAERRQDAVDYVHNQEMNAVVSILNPDGDIETLTDKVAFARACHDNDIPAFGVLTLFEGGDVAGGEVTSPEDLPAVDLFGKPAYGGRGRGVRSWRSLGPGHYEDDLGNEITAAQLFGNLKRAHRPYVLQRRVQAHPDLRPLSNGALPTVRAITGLWPNGDAELLFAILKMPTGDALADNFAAGGIAAPINLDTGELGTAAGKGPIVERLTHHPDTGRQIQGAMLPYWQQTRELCAKAHKKLSDFVFLGWDVAITEDGPRVVEANEWACMELLQKGIDRPVGGSPLNDLWLSYAAEGTP